MKKRLIISTLLLGISASVAFSQSDLTGYKIFVNPGHGGHDSNDRHMITTDFWESDGNLEKGLYLRELLQNLHATVYMSRVTNTTEDDLSLSVIDEMANAANVDFFLAIHSNGFAGTQNVPLMLFRGYDSEPVFPNAKNMANIMWQKLYEKGNCWTSSSQWVKGDWTFYPEWGDKVGLGVLRTLNMPGVLSEGSFHDYIPESWRLRNNDFLHHESWAFIRSFIDLYSLTPLSHGVIAGVVRDTLLTPSWYFKAGTRDQKQPLNGVKVTLTPGDKIYNVDNLNNGFFFFDSVTPGTYKLYFDGLADYYRDSMNVTVTANATTLADFYMQYDTTKVPVLLGFTPETTDSTLFNQEFTFTFSLPMNPDSVRKAVQLVPATDLSYTWDAEYKVLKIKPVVGYTSKTNYSLKLTTKACSKWKVKIATEKQYDFVTFSRQHLNIEKAYPSDGLTKVTLYPQVRVYFDAPISETSATSEIKLLNSLGQPLTKVRERFIDSGGKGAYFFETDQPLELNKEYKVSLSAVLTDKSGIALGEAVEYTFTTRTSAYSTGNVVESYEAISSFWDPEASGSTVGTNNSLTTFTSSSDVKFSGATSGKLDYVFTGASGGVCRVFDTSKPSVGSNANSAFGIWVFGDLSYNALEYWFYSNGSTNKIVSVDTIDWAGWDFKTVPYNSIGATGEILFHSTVLRQTAIGTPGGTLWFDNGTVFVPTGIEDEYAESLDIVFCPNPVSSSSKVKFTLAEAASVSISVYSIDGRKVEELLNENFDPGAKEVSWTPSSSLVNGIYLMRLEVRPLRGGPGAVVTGRWVLAR